MKTLWSPEEERLLKEGQDQGFKTKQLVAYLLQNGFSRSYASVENKTRIRQKLEWKNKAPKDPEPKQDFYKAPKKFFASLFNIQPQIIKTAWLYDSHYPHNINLKPLLHFLKDFKPDIFGFGGDNRSLDCISHWNEEAFKNYGMDNVMAAFNKDSQGFKRQVAEFIQVMPNSKFVYILGNHEDWLEQFIQKFPQVKKPTVKSCLEEVGEKIEFVPRGGFYQIGKLHFAHGDQFGTSNPAKQAVERTGKNIVFGHFHSHKEWPHFSMIDETEKHQGIQVPCYAKLAPGYLKGRPHDWSNGFFTACIKKSSGNFSPFVQKVSPEGNFITQDGREYS